MAMTDGIVFRAATRTDLEAIVDLLADDFLGETRESPGTPLHADYTDAFSAIEADPHQMLLVADKDGAIVGCLQITIIPGFALRGLRRGQIEGVRVATNERGSGIGHDMLQWAIEECRRRDCGLVQLTMDKSRSDARRFYESLGFVASHDGFKLKFG